MVTITALGGLGRNISPLLGEVYENLGSFRDHNISNPHVKIKRWPPASKTDTAASGP